VAKFANDGLGLHILETNFVYLDEGAFGVVFVDRHQKRIRKVYRVHPYASPAHCKRVFEAETCAYDVATRTPALQELVPKFFGIRSGQAIVDKQGEDVSAKFLGDLAFEAEFIAYEFLKISSVPEAERERVTNLFHQHGIRGVVDASVCLSEDGKVTKVIDFAMNDIELFWPS
jgi:hypothetical protein